MAKMDAELNKKINALFNPQTGKVFRTRERIARLLKEEIGISKFYVAVSGGKDSIAVLDLVSTAFGWQWPVLAIHNGHPGESLKYITRPVLVVKEPKAENVPVFLRTVELTCQIDGTRRDEDKMVRFDGKEIHRRDMPGDFTNDGVWGLKVLFPLYDWTEDEVYTYLVARNLPTPEAT